MVSIARKNLFHEKARLAISVLGIALAITLILLIEGFSSGMYRQVSIYYDQLGVDLIVGQRGVENMFSLSTVPASHRERLEELEGVDNVYDTLVIRTIFVQPSRKTPILLVGYDPDRKVGGPWQFSEGRAVGSNDEVVLDKALADRNGVRLGDRVELMGRSFEVVGLSAQTNSWMSPFVFITRPAAQELMRLEGAVSYFLVKADEGANVTRIRQEIREEIQGITVLTPSQIAQNNRDIMNEVAGTTLNLMVVVAFVIGVMVVGLTVQTAVVERIREYGVLKAVGASNRWLYRIVFAQGFTSTLLGFVAGTVIAVALANLIERLAPQFLISIDITAAVIAFILTIVMTAVASTLPIRRIAYVDPSLVFRG